MKVNRYQNSSIIENRVDIYFREENSEITALFEYINKKNTIIGSNGVEQKIITPDSVYYFEAVEKKCFAYLENEVFMELSQDAYTDIFISFSFPYLIGTFFYYRSIKKEVNKQNQILKIIKKEKHHEKLQ